MRINVAISSKTVYSFTLDPAIPHPGICPKYILTNIKKTFICTWLSTAVNRNNPIYKNLKQPKCPSVWNRLNKIWFIYSLNGLLCSYKKGMSNLQLRRDRQDILSKNSKVYSTLSFIKERRNMNILVYVLYVLTLKQ